MGGGVVAYRGREREKRMAAESLAAILAVRMNRFSAGGRATPTCPFLLFYSFSSFPSAFARL